MAYNANIVIKQGIQFVLYEAAYTLPWHVQDVRYVCATSADVGRTVT